MVETYIALMNRLSGLLNDKFAVIVSVILVLAAFWLGSKRRQPRAAAVCVILSAGIALGYTLIVYVRRLHG